MQEIRFYFNRLELVPLLLYLGTCEVNRDMIKFDQYTMDQLLYNVSALPALHVKKALATDDVVHSDYNNSEPHQVIIVEKPNMPSR